MADNQPDEEQPSPVVGVEQYNWFERPESKRIYEDTLRKYATQTTKEQVDIFDEKSRAYWDEFKPTIEQHPELNWDKMHTYPVIASFMYSTIYFKQEWGDLWQEWCRDGDEFFFQCQDMYGRYVDDYIKPTSGAGMARKIRTKNMCKLTDKKLVSMGSGRRVRIGRGIEAPKKDDPRYRQFGRFIIHIPSLEKCIINIRYPSLSNVAIFPKKQVSSTLRELVLQALNKNSVSKNDLRSLNELERDYFVRLCIYAEIAKSLGLSLPEQPTQPDKDMDRFELIKGEIIAGNNSPQLLRELKRYILKFLAEKKMNKREAYELLGEISILDL